MFNKRIIHLITYYWCPVKIGEPIVIPIYAMKGEISFEGAVNRHGGACSGVPRRGKAARRCPESMALLAREQEGGSSRAGCSLMVTAGCNFSEGCSGMNVKFLQRYKIPFSPATLLPTKPMPEHSQSFHRRRTCCPQSIRTFK